MSLPTYPATKARINFGALLKRVQTTDPRIIIEKDGVPTAMLVDMDWYEDMMDSRELESARAEGGEHVDYKTYFAKHV
jgi:prevent-host-death family protein